jgi:hypothetical protein
LLENNDRPAKRIIVSELVALIMIKKFVRLTDQKIPSRMTIEVCCEVGGVTISRSSVEVVQLQMVDSSLI